MRLRSHLVALVVVALLPVLVIAAVMVVTFSRQQMIDQEKRLANVAQAVSLDIDRELSSWIRACQALATSKYLDSGDLREFYNQSKRVLQTSGPWHNIILTDPYGQELVNLRLPYGATLPRVWNLGSVQQVVESATYCRGLYRGTNRRPIVHHPAHRRNPSCSFHAETLVTQSGRSYSLCDKERVFIRGATSGSGTRKSSKKLVRWRRCAS